METLIACDISGSTHGNSFYWNKVLNIINEYPQAQMVEWSSSISPRNSLQLLRERALQNAGGGGTAPELVASMLKQENFSHQLILITDGQVSNESVKRCDEILQQHEFSSVICYIIDSGGVNMSVVIPFTRNSPSRVYISTREGTREELSTDREALQLLSEIDQLNDLNLFLTKYDALEAVIISRNMGRNNPALRTKLLNLQKRLLQAYSKINSPSEEIEELRKFLQTEQLDSALALARTLTLRYYQTINGPSELVNKIQHLVRLCDLTGIYDMNHIKTSRAQRAELTEELQAPEVTTVEEMSSFICPLLYEVDTPALLLSSDGVPLLKGVEKEKVDMITNCPLFLLLYPELVEKMVSCLDHIVGVESLRMGGLPSSSPFTRKPIIGALTLGAETSHCKASDYSLSLLTTGGLQLGQPDLWLALVWYLIKIHPQLNYLRTQEELMKALEEHLRFRFEHHYTSLSLGMLPDYPNWKAPLGLAVWYCLHSTFITINEPKWDRTRAFLACLDPFKELMKVMKYPCKEDTRWSQLRVLSIMMSPYWKERRKELEAQVRSLYQAHLKIGEEWVFLDGPAQSSNVSPFLTTLEPGGIVALLKLADPQKKLSDLSLPYPFTYEMPQPVYNYSKEENNETNGIVEVCPYTFRPYYQPGGVLWKIQSEQKYGPLHKQLSIYQYYLDYVIEHGKYPSCEELILFCARKERNRSFYPRDTLPRHCITVIEGIVKQMKDLVSGVSIDEFRQIVRKGYSIINRVAMEKR